MNAVRFFAFTLLALNALDRASCSIPVADAWFEGSSYDQSTGAWPNSGSDSSLSLLSPSSSPLSSGTYNKFNYVSFDGSSPSSSYFEFSSPLSLLTKFAADGSTVGLTVFVVAQLTSLDSSLTWERFFDFGNGASADNIIAAFNGATVLIDAWAPGGGVQGVTGSSNLDSLWHAFAFRVTQTSNALTVDTFIDTQSSMSTYTTSTLLNTGARTHCYIGKSNWPSDPLLRANVKTFQYYSTPLNTKLVGNILTQLLTQLNDIAPDVWFEGSSYNASTGVWENLGGLTSVTATGFSNTGSSLPSVGSYHSFSYVSFTPSLEHYFSLGSQSFFSAGGGLTIFVVSQFTDSASPVAWERIFEFGSGPSTNNIFAARSNVLTTLAVWALPVTNMLSSTLDGDWHVYAFRVQQSGTVDSFIDTVQTQSTSSSGAIDTGVRTHCYIGRSNWPSDPYLSANIKTVQLFYEALTLSAISTILTNLKNTLIAPTTTAPTTPPPTTQPPTTAGPTTQSPTTSPGETPAVTTASPTTAPPTTAAPTTVPVNLGTVVYDNLDIASSIVSQVFSGFRGSLGNSFTLSSAFPASVLYSVTLLLSLTSDPAASSSVTVSLASDNYISPDSTLAVLGTVSPSLLSASSLSEVSFLLPDPSSLSAYTLTPGTRYWIVLSSADSGDSQVSWSSDDYNGGTGVNGEYNYARSTVLQNSGLNTPYQMKIEVVNATVSSSTGPPTTAAPNLPDIWLDASSYNDTTGIWPSIGALSSFTAVASGPTFPPIITALESGEFDYVSLNTCLAQYFTLPPFSMFSSTSLISGVTAFVVAQLRDASSPGSWERFFDFGNGAGVDNVFASRYMTTTEIEFRTHTSSSMLVVDTGTLDNAWHVYGFRSLLSGTTLTMDVFIDGATTPVTRTLTGATVSTTTRLYNYIGKSNWPADASANENIKTFMFYFTPLHNEEVLAKMAVLNAAIASASPTPYPNPVTCPTTTPPPTTPHPTTPNPTTPAPTTPSTTVLYDNSANSAQQGVTTGQGYLCNSFSTGSFSGVLSSVSLLLSSPLGSVSAYSVVSLFSTDSSLGSPSPSFCGLPIGFVNASSLPSTPTLFSVQLNANTVTALSADSQYWVCLYGAGASLGGDVLWWTTTTQKKTTGQGVPGEYSYKLDEPQPDVLIKNQDQPPFIMLVKGQKVNIAA